jgi:hypothetical protein
MPTPVIDLDSIAQSISELDNKMNIIKQDIIDTTEMMKAQYQKASTTMKENQNYFLSGIQTSIADRHYIITYRGIEVIVQGEIIPIPKFIDSVIEFANLPIRKIEVLKELHNHLKKINQIITTADAGFEDKE